MAGATGQRVPRPHPHAPQALLPVAQRLVDELDGAHRLPRSRSPGSPASVSTQRVWCPPARKAGCRDHGPAAARRWSARPRRRGGAARGPAVPRVVAVAAVRDQLGQQGVVVRRYGVAAVAVGVDAHAPADRLDPPGDACRGTGRTRARVLGVDPHSTACPVNATSDCRSRSGSPAATASCAATMSTPVTSSVTGCSTWMRVLTSRKDHAPVSASTTNSTVPAPDVAKGVGRARPRPRRGRGAPRRRRARRAPPRPASGSGAGPSSPAPRGGRRRRGRRRAPGPRRGGRG